ncbi:E-beta-farnesene synthase [Tanacetum coccineum]
MWEEFNQSIHTFIEDKKNLAQHTQGKKKATLIVILSIRFTKLIIHHLQSKHKFYPRLGSPLHLPNEESVLGYLKFSAKGTKREVFGMPIPNNLITTDIQGEQYYNAYLEKATKPKATKQSEPSVPKAAPVIKPTAAKAPKTTSSRPPKPTPATTEPFKKDQNEGVPVNEPRFGDEEADLQKAVEESLKDVHAAHQGPLLPVVIREPKSGKFQPLPEVQGKGKEKVNEEQAAQVLLNLQTPKKKSPADQYISKGAIESDEQVPWIDAGDQDEGQAGPNPDVEVTDTSIQQNPEQMDEEFTTTAYPNVQENLKLPTEDQVRLEEPASSAGTLSSLQNLDKEFSFTNQFLEEKSLEDEPEKTNIESEVQSMVTVPIHQDTSSVPLMTTPVIDLTVS